MKQVSGSGVVKKVADKEINEKFSFVADQVESLEEAIQYFTNPENAPNLLDDKGEIVKGPDGKAQKLDAGSTLAQLVNDYLERSAKAAAYQKIVAKHKPAEDPKKAFERVVRGLMSLGVPEDIATEQAKSAIARAQQAPTA